MSVRTAQLSDHVPVAKARQSLWLALLWKEWRQQRLAFGLLAATCLGWDALWCKLNNWRGDGTTLVGLLVFAALGLGVNAFATDSDDRSGDFVDQLPVRFWPLLVTKHLTAMGLATLCLVLPVVLMPPLPGDWGLYTWGPLAWGPEWSLAVAFVVASTAVALAGALARSGLGGMGTWLLAAGVIAATTVAPVLPTLVTSTRAPFLLGIALVWCVAHCWLLRVWSIHRPERVRVWRIGFWIALVLLTPILSGMPAVSRQWLFVSPLRAISEPYANTWAIASPDGRTVAVTADHYRSEALYHAETWLLDTDTGQSRRFGPRWRCARAVGWSPDGRKLRLRTTRSLLPVKYSGNAWFANIEERVYDVTDGGARLLHRRFGSGDSGAGWFGDGTYVTGSSTGWTFMDLETGETKHCLHVADSFVEKVPTAWEWLPSAIVAAQYNEDEEGKGWLRIGRGTPDLERLQTKCLPADPAVARADLRAARISPDGRWLLLMPPPDPRAPSDQPGKPFGVLSLEDGSGCLLQPQTALASSTDRPFFTPDGSLLVAQLVDGLEVWNLASGEAKPEGKIPLPRPSWSPVEIARDISPKPPWRVALAYAGIEHTYVVDLAERQTTTIPPSPIPPIYPHCRRQVSWLDNDRLLVECPGDYRLWVVKADGSSQRQVFP